MNFVKQFFLVLSITGLTLAGLAGCATQFEAPKPETSTLVWPSAPEVPRVVFVQTLSRPADLGISKNFFARLVDIVFGETPARLIRPMAVLDDGDMLYVADPGAKGVHRFDKKAGKYDLIQLANKQPMLSPVGLALGDKHSVWVTDSALGAVYLIKLGAEFAEPMALAEKLGQPTGIAFDARLSKLFVADTTAHSIRVFGPGGTLLATIGKRGTDQGEFNYPTMLWHSFNGQLMVTDSLNFRTQIFDASGRFVTQFGRVGDSTGDTPRQKGVATDRFGHIYVVDSVLHGVQIFNESGQLLLSLGGLGEAPGEFRVPSGIFVGTDDMIYVADAYNQRVQVFKYVGGAS